MQSPPHPTDYSVFLDTTELHSAKTYVTLPTPVEPSLTRISYYVSRLSVEELAVQLYLKFAKDIKPGLEQFSRLIAKTDVEPNMDHFRKQITADLLRVPGLRVFDPMPHGVLEQKLLFEARHHGAYKDAIIYGSAIAYAKSNSLPQCSFVTQDMKEKDFFELGKTLSSIYPMKLMTKVAFKNMLQFNTKLYDAIISRLQTKFEDQAKLLRRELVKRAQVQPAILSSGPEALEFIESLNTANSDLSPIVVEVRNIAVSADNSLETKMPTNVACKMSVHYSVTGILARLYWANASATLIYSAGELADVQVTDFNLNWIPYA